MGPIPIVDEHLATALRRATTGGCFWGLQSKDGWAAAPSEDSDRDVYVLWTSKAGAQRCARDEWADYEPAPIPMARFLGTWLPGMKREGYLVGFDWGTDLDGEEYEPSDVASAILVMADALPGDESDD